MLGSKRTHRRLGVCALSLGLAFGGPPGRFGPSAARAQPPETDVSDSPRGAISAFLEATRAGQYERAARFLGTPAPEVGDPLHLAFQLKAVLDRHLWVDLEAVSPDPQGDPGDGLEPGVDELGTIPGPSGQGSPVRLIRASTPPHEWVLAPAVVSRIDGWYRSLPGAWLRGVLPEPLQRPGPADVLWWQWGAILLLLGVAITAGLGVARLMRRALTRLTARTETPWDDGVATRLGAPLTLLVTAVIVRSGLPVLGLYTPAEAAARGVIRAALIVTAFWAAWRTIDAAAESFLSVRGVALASVTRTLVSMGARLGKVALIIGALVMALRALGVEVTGLLAGLGLGGLAVALAAQKSVENLFGGVALAVDSPFGVGDFVRIEDFVGTVEAIGLRTTRIRTLDRTLVTIPNGRLADMRLENFSVRDRILFACTVGVTYETRPEILRRVVEDLEALLRAHPKIWPDAVVVRLAAFGASSLDIEVKAWFETRDWGEFQRIRQTLMLEMMGVVERAGAGFAYPTQTIHLART
jgi:MscS family membrane protein